MFLYNNYLSKCINLPVLSDRIWTVKKTSPVPLPLLYSGKCKGISWSFGKIKEIKESRLKFHPFVRFAAAEWTGNQENHKFCPRKCKRNNIPSSWKNKRKNREMCQIPHRFVRLLTDRWKGNQDNLDTLPEKTKKYPEVLKKYASNSIFCTIYHWAMETRKPI